MIYLRAILELIAGEKELPALLIEGIRNRRQDFIRRVGRRQRHFDPRKMLSESGGDNRGEGVKKERRIRGSRELKRGRKSLAAFFLATTL